MTDRSTTQAVSDRGTAALLLLTTALAAWGWWQVTNWNATVWWRAGLMLIGGYLTAATLLLGANRLAVLTYREYHRLRP